MKKNIKNGFVVWKYPREIFFLWCDNKREMRDDSGYLSSQQLPIANYVSLSSDNNVSVARPRQYLEYHFQIII